MARWELILLFKQEHAGLQKSSHFVKGQWKVSCHFIVHLKGGTEGPKTKNNLNSSINPYMLQFSSVAQSCPTLCNPMNRSTPGLPVHH